MTQACNCYICEEPIEAPMDHAKFIVQELNRAKDAVQVSAYESAKFFVVVNKLGSAMYFSKDCGTPVIFRQDSALAHAN